MIPKAAYEFTEDFVRALLGAQFPHLAGLPLRLLGAGWDNVNYRLGEAYIVRLPRRAEAVPLLEKEMYWQRQLKDLLPIPIPHPLWVGQPSAAFPWPWAITPWHSGGHPVGAPLAEGEVARLVGFLQALHGLPPNPAWPDNPVRALPLTTKAEQVAERWPIISAGVALPWAQLWQVWQQALAAPLPPQRVLIHGDIHPKNVLIDRGRIAAIIDWGDMCAGDPATDLMSLWLLVHSAEQREWALARYGADAAMRARAMGWAVFLGSVYVQAGLENDESYLPHGVQILRNVAGIT